jgi:hypothetical protein
MSSWLLTPVLGFFAGLLSQATKMWLKPLGSRYSTWRTRLQPDSLGLDVVLVIILFPIDMLLTVLIQLPSLIVMFVSSYYVTGDDLRTIIRGDHVWVVEDILRAGIWLVALGIGVVIGSRLIDRRTAVESQAEVVNKGQV